MVRKFINILVSVIAFICTANEVLAQVATVSGKVISEGKPVVLVSVVLAETNQGGITDSSGHFLINDITPSTYHIHVSCVGYDGVDKQIILKSGEHAVLNI